MPPNPRHGSVLPVTAQEYEALLLAYQPDQIITKCNPVTLKLAGGFVSDRLPKFVSAEFADGKVRDVRVIWEDIAEHATNTGSFSIHGELQADTKGDIRAAIDVHFS